MRKIFCLTLLLFLILTKNIDAQVVRIQDEDTQKPIELATVASNSPRIALTTDENGEVDISL